MLRNELLTMKTDFSAIAPDRRDTKVKISKNTENDIFQEYLRYLHHQFVWLKKIIPDKHFSQYLNLVAFSNNKVLDDRQKQIFQLQDLYSIIALWELDLLTQENRISQHNLDEINTHLSKLTQGVYKQGLVTRNKILQQEQLIIDNLTAATEITYMLNANDYLPPDLKMLVEKFLSLSIFSH